MNRRGCSLDQGAPQQFGLLRRQGLASRQSAPPEDSQRVVEAQGALGACLLRLGRLAEAEPYLRTAYEVLQRTLGEDDEQTRTARRDLETARASVQSPGR